MENAEPGVVIVGASIAGLRTAMALRRRGWTGVITLIGEESHWPPFDRPPLSKGVLADRSSLETARLRVPDGFDATVVLGRRASGLDLDERKVELDDGRHERFSHLVVATGSTPRRLGSDHSWLHVLRSAEDSQRLSADLGRCATVAIVGAGFIGCEVASTCRELGLVTHVVEAGPSPLPPLGLEIGRVIARRLTSAGVELHVGVGVTYVDEIDGRPCVGLANGDTIDADIVLVAIGVTPNTGWLAGSGLVVDDGLCCDATCFALNGGGRVAAAGDVARWDHPRYGSIRIEHWTNAVEQAGHVGAIIAGGAPSPFAPVPYVWSDQFGSKLQLIGRPTDFDQVTVEEGDPDAAFVAAYSTNGALVAALCVDSPRAVGPWTARIQESISSCPVSRP